MEKADLRAWFSPVLIRQVAQQYGASDADVALALHAAEESVRAAPGSEHHFEQLVLSRARLYLHRKALDGLWPVGGVH